MQINLKQSLSALGASIILFIQTGCGGGNAGAEAATKDQMEMLKLALEKYHEKFGEYPKVKDSHATSAALVSNGTTFPANSTVALYQAISGDGNDRLDLPSQFKELKSNGTLDSGETEISKLPAEMIKEVEGIYFLVDGYGKPWQYRNGNDPRAINKLTYDLWSLGESMEYKEDQKEQSDPNWIRNW